MIRKIDNLGRVVIPKEIRKQHSMREGDTVVLCQDFGQLKYKNFQFLV